MTAGSDAESPAPASFEEIGHESGGAVGPAAVLLCGFEPEADAAVAALLERVGAGEHRVRPCTVLMVGQTLEEALDAPAGGDRAPADALPRVLVLSGLTGSAIHAFLDRFGETGLPRPIFASATPTSLGFAVRDLLRDLLAEQNAMRGPKS